MKRKTTRSIIIKGRKTHRRTVRQMTGDVDDLCMRLTKIYLSNARQYPISTDQLAAFMRINSRPDDCVINAMEILKLLDAQKAGLSRSLILPGSGGILTSQLIEFMDNVEPMYRHELKTVQRAEYESLLDDLLPSNCLLATVRWNMAVSGHVVLIVKGLDKQFYILDPQRQDAPEFQGTFLYSNFPDPKPDSIQILCSADVEKTARPMDTSE